LGPRHLKEAVCFYRHAIKLIARAYRHNNGQSLEDRTDKVRLLSLQKLLYTITTGKEEKSMQKHIIL
jgi:hypothetical protein